MKKNIIDSATLDIVELIAAIADKVCHIKFDADILEKIATFLEFMICHPRRFS